MSKISLKPNASGTGVFSLEAPNSNVDRTLNLPDEAGTLATVENLPAGYTDSDALDLFNATGSAPVYACRAWVNFDGTGTVSIRDSGNVSSVTDQGTGEYNVNFTVSMPSSDYAALATPGDSIAHFAITGYGNVIETGYFRVAIGQDDNVNFDDDNLVKCAVFH